MGTASEDETVIITKDQLLAGASDLDDGDVLDVTNVTLNNANQGTIIDNGDGTWTYTPANDQGAGNVKFNFTVSDGENTTDSFANLHLTDSNSDNKSDGVNLTVNDAGKIVNPHLGFEGEIADNWNVIGNVKSAQNKYGTRPTEGSKMANLDLQHANSNISTVELDLGLNAGALDDLLSDDDSSPSSITAIHNNLYVQEGDVITFDWNFVDREKGSEVDTAIVVINGKTIVLTNSDDTEYNNSGDWNQFSYTITADDASANPITFGVAMVNGGDDKHDSKLLVDNIEVTSALGDEIALDIDASLVDTDGSETLAIQISNLPDGAVLNKGSESDGIWTLEADDLEGLTITPADGFVGTMNLEVTAIATETSNGDTSTSSQTLEVTVTEFDVLSDVISNFAPDNSLENDLVTVSGELDDNDDIVFENVNIQGTYGSLALVSSVWTYTLNEDVQDNLASGASVDDVITLTSLDGSTQDINITITGSNNDPELSYSVSEISYNDAPTLAPIVMDLDGDGVEYSQLNNSEVMFDTDNDGIREHVAWAGSDDGILVFDFDNDNDITQTNEVSFIGYQEGAQTDLEGLRAFDTNEDGRLDAQDNDWDSFKVWNDADLDGDVDEGELYTTEEIGVSGFSLESDDNMNLIGDIIEHGKSTYTTSDGEEMEFSDAEFVYQDNDFEVANFEEFTSSSEGEYDSPDLSEEDVVGFYNNAVAQEDYLADTTDGTEYINGTVDSFIANTDNDIDTVVVNFENTNF